MSEQTIAQTVIGDSNIFSATGDVYVYNPPPPLSPDDAKKRRELEILLGRVKEFWIEGVFKKSLHNVAVLDLAKETLEDAVEATPNPLGQVLELPDQPSQILSSDEKIIDIFDDLKGGLLILGRPGSGKTFFLLQLARDLIRRVEEDETFSYPIPTVFNLSSWTKGQSLIDWMVEQLLVIYQIPKHVSREWLRDNRLLPMLDGLDEVTAIDQAACVKAINQITKEFGLAGLVVCSRITEYTSLPIRLKLNGAICLQPLTLTQVQSYLAEAGDQLTALRFTLQEDKTLQILAQSPLTLGIMSLAYKGLSVQELTDHALDSVEERRKHLFNMYIERMFKRKGQADKSRTVQQTVSWLSWLAQKMTQHNQSIFLVEQLQPSWLSSRSLRWLYVLGSRLLSGLIFGLVFSVIFSEFYGLGLGLIAGLSVGFVDGWRFNRGDKQTLFFNASTRWQLVINVLGVGLIVGLIVGLSAWLLISFLELGGFSEIYSGIIDGMFIKSFNPVLDSFDAVLLWLREELAFNLILGTSYGLLAGVIFGLVFGLRAKWQILQNDVRIIEALKWSWRDAIQGWLLGALLWPILVAAFGVINWMADDLSFTLWDFLMTDNVRDYRFFEKLIVAWKQMTGGIMAWLILAFRGGVVGALLFGLSAKSVEKNTIRTQGMPILAGLVFALVGVFISWLGKPQLVYSLGGRYFGWNIALEAAVGSGVIAFLWYGGLDMIQHFVLRLILWYQGHTPRNYHKFLNYAVDHIFLQKVGGGYIFIHRLLLEHFASMNETTELTP